VRDELVGALGDKITVQESDWNCGGIIEPNHKRKPFDDPRVRRTLTLAIDRWHGAPRLARIANVHTVGGIVFPGSPLAATEEELQKMELSDQAEMLRSETCVAALVGWQPD
jgi:peptide/nickel transport system substrate-binding protein